MVARTGYSKKKGDLPHYDDMGRRTDWPEARLSRFLRTFHFTLPFLFLEKGAETRVQIDPNLTRSMDEVLTDEELPFFLSEKSHPSDTLFLIPQPEPIQTISLEERSTWLLSNYPHLMWGTWEDLWSILCTFRIPDRSVLVAGTPLQKADGSQYLGTTLQQFVLLSACERGDLKLEKKLVQKNTFLWIARPRP